ncbi:unnamed protein product [Lepidochelys olivacea]
MCGKLQVTMQSSSAEVTMMESQNRKRAPAWTEQELQDLIAVWGEESVLSELRSSFRNAKTFVKISQGMKDRGHNRDPKQCCMKLKELRQAYQKTREANGRSRSEPQTCCFYDELHAILGGSATTTPAVLFDSFNGDGGNTEAVFGDEEDDDEVVDSSQQASGETGFPNSQELFLTLDLEPLPPEPTQGCLLDLAGREGTSAMTLLWTLLTGKEVGQRMLMYWLLCVPASASGAARLSLEEEEEGYNEWNYQGVTRMTGLVLREPELRLVLSAYAADVLLVIQDLGDLARVEACQAIYSAASSARVNWVKSSGLAVGDWRQRY